MAEAQTVGNEDDVECPTCGTALELMDWRTDGCLRAGEEGECYKCGAHFRITAVDWEPTVYVEPMHGAGTTEGK